MMHTLSAIKLGILLSSLGMPFFNSAMQDKITSILTNSSPIRLGGDGWGGGGGQNKFFLMAATSSSPSRSVGVRSRREMRHALRSHFNLLLGHLILYNLLACLIDP